MTRPGAKELPEFQRQSETFVEAWRAAGQECELVVVEGLNHFEMGAAFGDAECPFVQAILRQMALA